MTPINPAGEKDQDPIPEQVPRLRCRLCRTDLTETVSFDGEHLTMVHAAHDGASAAVLENQSTCPLVGQRYYVTEGGEIKRVEQ